MVKVLSDPTAGLNAILAGEVNALPLIGNDKVAEVEGAGWTLNTNEIDFQTLLLMDRAGTVQPELADVRVRQAINYALDRESMLEGLQFGYGAVTTQVFPERSEAYDPALDDAYPYDPEKARELLAEAGYPDGFTLQMPTVVFIAPNNFTILQQQLADVGITVEYTDIAPNNFLSDLYTAKFASAFMQLEQNSDWQLIQFMISPTAPFNPFHYSDATVEELLETYQYGDEETRSATVKELNQYLVDQAWFAPLYRLTSSIASDPETAVAVSKTNVVPNLFDFQPK